MLPRSHALARPLARPVAPHLARLAAPALGLALAACHHGAADAPLANRNASAAATGVRAIDWRNRSYALEELGAVTVKDGRADFAIDDDGKVVATGATPGSFRVEPPLFTDIDGNGTEDAIIAASLGTGGTGQFSQVMVFTLRGGNVVELGGIPGGDRGDGGIRHVALDGNAVIVERNVLAEGDGACCASTWRRERWVWKAGALTEDVAARGPAQPVP
jgi:hypothetical protein